MKQIATLTFGVIWLGAAHVLAGNSHEILARVPKAELPAKAAGLIKDAQAPEREAVTTEVVKSAVSLNPAGAPVIVSAIARIVPDMAALAAGVAAGQQPKQASIIARAAAAAAPSKAAKIVVAVCRAVPKDYRNIAVAVAAAAPGANKEILSAVALALPELKPGIERVMTGYNGNPPSVSYALASATQPPEQSPLPSSSGSVPAPLARGPVIGPPYIPLTQTPTNVTPSTGGNVPPGSRGTPTDYAQP